MKHCCKNCHFLAKVHVGRTGEERTHTWGEEERSNLRLRIEEDHRAACRKGIWDTGVDPHLNSSLKDILLEDRKDNCFFIEAHKGMLFDTANELLRLRNDNRQLRRSYRYTQVGLWIAAAGLTANVLLQLGKILGWLPQ